MQEIFSGWFLVNIVAPLILPIFGLLVLRLLPLPVPATGLSVMTTVKDGQLCWAVIAMGAATIYELWEHIQKVGRAEAWQGGVLGGMVMIMLPAMLIAAGGAVFTTPLLAPGSPGATASLRAWISHYKVFVGSLVMAIISAIVYTVVHFVASP